MWIDSENNSFGGVTHYDDDGFFNHITWLTSSSHNENHRYNDVYNDYKSKAPASSSDSCAKLQSALDTMNGKVASANAMSTGSKGARRVRNRHIKAAKNWRNKIQDWYNAGQCAAVLTTTTPGCTDMSATNYNPNADTDDGSCVFPSAIVYGCTDSGATNYDPTATNDNGNCIYPAVSTTVYGCMDNTAINYDSTATVDNGTCKFPAPTNIFVEPPGTELPAGIGTLTGTDVGEAGMGDNKTLMYVVGGLAVLGLGYYLMKK